MSKKQKIDPDYFLALTLQRKFNDDYKREKSEKSNGNQSSTFDIDLTTSPAWKRPGPTITAHPNTSNHTPYSSTPIKNPSFPPVKQCHNFPTPSKASSSSQGLNDSQWEVIDPTPDVHGLFVAFGKRFFHDRLGSVEVKWSKRMTSCAGVCRFKGRRDRFGRGIGEVTISLSEPLLKLRPRSDLVNTLLHEMIHAYLFLFTENVNRADRDDHGAEFQQHMHRINKEAGTKITIYHSFHDEVKLYKQHWWQCNGPCKSRPPFFGLVKRATNRAPGKYDFWFASHQAECGGLFIKIKEPDNFKARGPRKNKENLDASGGVMGATRGKLGAIGGPSTLGGPSTSNGNIHGFGKPGNTGSKHLPTPGQPKIVGFIDLNKSPAPTVSGNKNPLNKLSAPTVSGHKNPLNSNASGSGQQKGPAGGHTLGRSHGVGGNKLGASSVSDGFFKLGTPLNKTRPTGAFGSPTKSFRPNSTLTKPSGNLSSRPVNPVGSKLLDKLNFDSKNNHSSGNVKPSGSDNRGMGSSSRGGFSGARGGGTRMNPGSGTVLLNPTKAVSAEPNETAQRIAKPVNSENKLNLDHFKPFMGQGQTLGGGYVQPDRSKSRLLSSNTISTGSTQARDSANGGNSRDTFRNTGNSGIRDKNSASPAHTNKKVCLGDRSVYPCQPSTSHSSVSSLSNSSSRANTSSNQTSKHSNSNNTKANLSWDLGDEELEDDYEYKKLHKSFTKDSKPDPSEKVPDSLDKSFGEMENMMNDTDVEVFENISDEILSGTIESGENDGWDANSTDRLDTGRLNETNVEINDRIGGIDDRMKNEMDEFNSSLDDIFEISSEEDPEDVTHCPVCNKAIARAAMNQHLENCMELSQVFENVAIDEDDDDEEESEREQINERSNSDTSKDNTGESHAKDNNRNKETTKSKHGRNDVMKPNERGLDDGNRTNEPANLDNGNGLVKCPICSADILQSTANEHIDECLARNISQEMV